MAKKRNKPDRGQLLAAVVEASHFKKEDIARKAGYSRSAYYKHIENPDLDYSIMTAYGKAIPYDFTDDLPEMPKYLLSEPDDPYNKPQSLEAALKILEQWKNKYLELLEKYNKLLEEKSKK